MTARRRMDDVVDSFKTFNRTIDSDDTVCTRYSERGTYDEPAYIHDISAVFIFKSFAMKVMLTITAPCCAVPIATAIVAARTRRTS